MRPFISTPEDEARIKAIAETWIGTHYIPDGAVRGTGCSCSMLPYVILKEMGFDVPFPPVRGAMLKAQILPTMMDWIAAHEGTHFERLPLKDGEKLVDVRVGDVLLFDTGIGHLALSLGGTAIIHSWIREGVHYTQIGGDAYEKRLIAVWRPVVKE